MPLDQRFAILGLAQAAGAWIVEDDFDGEYTFRGQPQPAMQGLTGDGRVIYVGTFAKTLFPAMRLGFMVVPPDLAERMRTALSVTGQFAPLVLQAALADFIEKGYFFRHLNRMRHLYARRRQAFVELFGEHLGRWLDPIDGRTGIQIASTFRTPARRPRHRRRRARRRGQPRAALALLRRRADDDRPADGLRRRGRAGDAPGVPDPAPDRGRQRLNRRKPSGPPRGLPGDPVADGRDVDLRRRGEQGPGVGMLGRGEDGVAAAVFDRLAEVHHHHVVGDVADHRQVVAR